MIISASILLPILFTIALGALLERLRPVDTSTLSTLTLYLLTPALVFYSLLTTHLAARDATELALFLPMLTAGLWLTVKGYLWIGRVPYREEGALMLCVLFMNAGNFGIPMCARAFGPQGVEQGVIWVVMQNSLLFPLAIWYAARDTHGTKGAFRAVFRLPFLYTVALALGMRALGFLPPPVILEPVRSIGYAMIPVAQLLLGAQLSKTVRVSRQMARAPRAMDISRLGGAVGLRLIASPALAVALTGLMGAEGLTRKVIILLSGAPTAVNVSLLALEFDNRPHFIAATVFLSTLLSFVTLSVVLIYLIP